MNRFNTIAGYRVMLGFTQMDMAKELGISRQTYSNKELGKRSFNDKEKQIIKKIFNQIDNSLTIDKIFFEHQPS